MGLQKKYIHNITSEAISIYNLFQKKEGSEHISSPVGIQVLLSLIDETKPQHILEIGGGIGALSYAAVTHSNVHIDIFEDHPFCLQELKKNLEGFESRYTIFENYRNFTLPRTSYDLVIIDGGGHAFIRDLVTSLSHIKRIMIEGGRAEQRKQARRALRAKYIFRPVQYIDRTGKHKGAHQIICHKNNI